MNSASASTRLPDKPKDQKHRGSWKKTVILLTMVAPGAIWLVILRYLPMFGILLSFKNYQLYYDNPTFINNFIHSDWVAFNNFKFLFTGTQTWTMLRNTVGYNVLFIILGIIIPVAFAIMLNEITHKRMTKIYQTMMFFPFFLSWVVVSYFVLAFFAPGTGLVVNMQKNMGITPFDWYANPKPWPWILIFCQEWKNVGYTCIMYLAAITGIDTTQYEAARIDGASKIQQARYITLPFLRTIIVILFIVNIGRIFNSDFGLFFTVPKDSASLIPVTQVMDTYVYRALTAGSGDVGMTSAAGLFQSGVGFILIMISNSIVKRVDPDSAMF